MIHFEALKDVKSFCCAILLHTGKTISDAYHRNIQNVIFETSGEETLPEQREEIQNNARFDRPEHR